MRPAHGSLCAVSPLHLPASTDSVPVARRFVAQQLSGAESRADVETAVLLVSEVVTNAILHARTPLVLDVLDSGSEVRVEVRDGSPAHPRIHAFSRTSATGRGLRLLDRLAERWGVEVDPASGGKVVWFVVGLPSDAAWAVFDDDWLVEGVGGEL